MSNYHYNDQSGCQTCLDRSAYSSLANTTNYTCDQPCLCRFTNERSTKDRMYYNWFVLNEPVVLPLDNQKLSNPSQKQCQQK